MNKVIIRTGGHILGLMMFGLLVFLFPLVAILLGMMSVDTAGDLLIFPLCGYMIFFLSVYIKSWKLTLDDHYLINSEPEKWNQIFPKFISSKVFVGDIKKILICRASSLRDFRKKEQRKKIVFGFDPIMLVELKSGESSSFRLKPFSTKGVRGLVREFKNREIKVSIKDNLI